MLCAAIRSGVLQLEIVGRSLASTEIRLRRPRPRPVEAAAILNNMRVTCNGPASSSRLPSVPLASHTHSHILFRIFAEVMRRLRTTHTRTHTQCVFEWYVWSGNVRVRKWPTIYCILLLLLFAITLAPTWFAVMSSGMIECFAEHWAATRRPTKLHACAPPSINAVARASRNNDMCNIALEPFRHCRCARCRRHLTSLQRTRARAKHRHST